MTETGTETEVTRRAWLRPLAWLVVVLAGLWLLAPLVSADVQPADSGELQLVVRHLGVAHPPGYPLYTVTAHTFGRLANLPGVASVLGAGAVPAVGDGVGADRWTWATNFFSLVLAVLTLGLVAQCVHALTGSWFASVLGLASLFGGPTFLAQSGIANIRMPTALLTALLLALTVRWLERGAADARDPGTKRGIDWELVGIALAFGLAAGHHPSLVVLGPLVAVLIVLRRPPVLRDARTLLAVVAALLLSLLPLLYLPLRDRAGAVLAPGGLDTAVGIFRHVTGYGFRGDVLYFTDGAALVDRTAVLWNILLLQVGVLGLALAALGAVWLLWRHRASGVLLVGTVALMAALAVTYRAPQTMEYLLPAYVALAVLVGGAGGAIEHYAARWLGERTTLPHVPISSMAVLFVAGLLFLPRRDMQRLAVAAQPPPAPVTNALRSDCVPEGGRILASWHFATPLWYAADGIIPRPDLAVDYVYPEGAEPIGETWRRRLAASDEPTALTNRSQQILLSDTPLYPLAGTPFFTSVPIACGPESAMTPVRAAFGDEVVLESARLDAPTPWTVTLAFSARSAVGSPLTIVAQLVDPVTGAVWGQVDHTHGPARWNAPDGLLDRLTLIPFRGEVPARLEVHAGVYRNTPDGPVRLPVEGHPSIVLGEVAPPPTAPGSPPASPRPWWDLGLGLGLGLQGPGIIAPFGNAMTLADAAVHRSGDGLVVDLTWMAEDAHTSDYTVSVQAHGDGWTAQHDGTPAQGAIPTLKWLPGMVIRDRHRVALPPDLPEDAPFTVTVGVYDAFSLEPLPVADAELVRQGQGQAVRIHENVGVAPRYPLSAIRSDEMVRAGIAEDRSPSACPLMCGWGSGSARLRLIADSG